MVPGSFVSLLHRAHNFTTLRFATAIRSELANTTACLPIPQSSSRRNIGDDDGIPAEYVTKKRLATARACERSERPKTAGHGAQWDFPEAEAKGQHIEALCPSDRGINDAAGNIVPDITDREFSILLEELHLAKGDHIVVIMDCCFSGGMTRVVPEIGTADRLPLRAFGRQVRLSAHTMGR